MTHYTTYQLAIDEATYGPNDGKFIVTTADLKDELSGPMSEKDARSLAAALNACQMVVDRWEKGDLAEAARACGEAVAAARARRVVEPKPIVIEVRGGVVVEVSNMPAGARYEVKDWDDEQ